MDKLVTKLAKHTKCEECNHSFTFHRNGLSPCRAFGCVCLGWVGTLPEDAEKAAYVGQC
jgi:hypothetical protein